MVNIYIEYMAVIIILIPVRMIEGLDQWNKDIIIISSPTKLIDGGSAKLAKHAKNHQEAIRGKMVCSPRAKVIVRLWVRS